MEGGDLSEVGYPPRPLPFLVKTDDINAVRGGEVWRSGKIHRLEEYVASIVELTLFKWDVLYRLSEGSEEAGAADASGEMGGGEAVGSVPLEREPPSEPPDIVGSTENAESSLAAFVDPTRKLIKLIQLQLECSKLQSTLFSMGESDNADRLGLGGSNGGRREPLLAVMCGNGYDRAAQAFLEAAAALEVAIHNEGVQNGNSDLIEAWKSDSRLAEFSPERPIPGNLLKSLLEHPTHPRSHRPLHIAALHGKKDFCRLLLHYGADIDGQDKKGRTALFWALKTHNADMAIMLLQQGATVTDREFAMALEHLYSDVVELMLQRNSGCSGPNMIRRSKRKGRTLNSFADIISSPMKIVVEVKQIAPRLRDDVRLGDSSDDSIHVALGRIFEEDEEEVAVAPPPRSVSPEDEEQDILDLFEQDANRRGFKPKTEVISLLLNADADINVRDTRLSPLLAAAKSGDEPLLDWFHRRGGDLLLTFENAHFDSYLGNIASDANLLHYASYRVIPYLISKGVDSEHPDAEGRTPFYVKAKVGCVLSMKALLRHNRFIDVNARTKAGKSPFLALLVKMSAPRMMDFVMSEDFDPQRTVDSDGWTVLFYAAVLGSVEICRSLLIKGARSDSKDVFGNYPFVYALVAHNFYCASLLAKQVHQGFPRRWVSDFSSVDNISVVTRKVKNVFNGIYKNLYESVDGATDEEPYLTVAGQPMLHLTLTHGFLHALEDPLNTLVGRPVTMSRAKVVTKLVRTLLQMGFDPNVRSLRNETALSLILGIRRWHHGLDIPSVTLLLLRYGAEATVLDGRGRNLIDLSLRSESIETATYVFLAGAALKPRHRERLRELNQTHNPHYRRSRSDKPDCPYASYQPCMICLLSAPLSLKSTARIVIRRNAGSSLANTRAFKRLKLPRQLLRYLYLDDMRGSTASDDEDLGADWLDDDDDDVDNRNDDRKCVTADQKDVESLPSGRNDDAFSQFLASDF